jgi:CyaY protein
MGASRKQFGDLMPEPEKLQDAWFRARVAAVLRAVARDLDAVDSDEFDVHLSEGNLYVEFERGDDFVLSQQAPVSELWLAADRKAWHFRPEAPGARWVERDTGQDLSETLSRLLSERLGVPVRLLLDP